MTSAEFCQAMLDIGRGDSDALRKIYDEYAGAVLGVAFSVLKSRPMAEDVLQDVFLKIWSSPESFRENFNHRAWLLEIARNKALDYRRKTKNETLSEFGDAEPAGVAGFEDNLIDRLDAAETLLALPPDDRQIVALHAVGGLPYRIIAKMLNIPPGTAAWKYARGIGRLKKLFAAAKETEIGSYTNSD